MEPKPGEVWRSADVRKRNRNLIVLEVTSDGSPRRYARCLSIPFVARKGDILCRNGISKPLPRWKEVWIRLDRMLSEWRCVVSTQPIPYQASIVLRGPGGRFAGRERRGAA